jgi:hypothetical protein
MNDCQNHNRTILFAGHGPNVWWRVGWRLRQNGWDVNRTDLAAIPSFTALSEPTTPAALFIEMGTSEPEITLAMNFLNEFQNIYPGLPVAALVPRLLNHSRPAWAELGVGLVLDRATAPPLIADQLDRWLLPKIEPVE